MKMFPVLATLALILCGCDYEIPLVTQPSENIDPKLYGTWIHQRSNEEEQQLLILPMSTCEVLVVYPVNTKETMYGRCAIWSPDELDLFQINWFGKADGSLPPNKRTYQYAAWSLNGNTLNVHLLNPQLIEPSIASATQMADKIISNVAEPNLFREVMVFKRGK